MLHGDRHPRKTPRFGRWQRDFMSDRPSGKNSWKTAAVCWKPVLHLCSFSLDQGAPGVATSKDALLGVPGPTTRNKDAMNGAVFR